MPTRRIVIACLVTSVSAGAKGAFDETDVIQIQPSVGFSYDSNLYRLPDVDPTLFGINPDNKADTTRIKGVGIRINKGMSRQRLLADVNLSETTYDKNTNLDFFGGVGRFAWFWQVGNHWSGEASYRKSRALGGFSDFRQSTKDLIDTDIYTLTAGYQFHPRWRVVGELVEIDSAHSAATRIALNHNSRTAGVTLTYRSPAENSIGVQAKHTEGSYPNRQTVGLVAVDNSYSELRLNALGAWRPSGMLRLDGQVGHVERTHELLPIRDYSGFTWRTAATWEPTAKFRMAMSGSRDIRNFEDIATSYLVVTGYGISPTYAITPKIVVQGDLTHETRNYRGDPGFLLLAAPARVDKLRISRISVTYSPLRNIDLTMSYESGDRRSTTSSNDFDYQSWFGTIRVAF